MIIYKEMRWGNVFSYGPNNRINFQDSSLTQLVGKNGHGKSSIPLILEEVQFNTNSKKIAKAKVINRYVKDKSYWIELDFDKDGDNYTISTVRGSTSTVKFLCNGVDISSHTATGTYKLIEETLGYDHKAFSQIVYQSSVSSLEFLTATDTARKKFLIDLLNLEVYSNAADLFKVDASVLSKQVDTLQGKVQTVQDWLTKYSSTDLTKKVPKLVPLRTTAEEEALADIKHKIANADDTNKRIIKNNTYKEVLDKLPDLPLVPKPASPEAEVNPMIASINAEIKSGDSFAKQCSSPDSSCPTCGTKIDKSKEYSTTTAFLAKKPKLLERLAELKQKLQDYNTEYAKYTVYVNNKAEIEKYHALYDPSVPSELVDKTVLAQQASELVVMIKRTNDAIVEAEKFNKDVEAHNSRVQVISEQIVEMEQELNLNQSLLLQRTNELTKLNILVKAFSPTGLLAYKIESMVKDLESVTNEYLGILAQGRFQLSFQISSADKLNVVITDNGNDIDINALSTGERARVNVATLLAIRKLMQALSNSRTNLLILDETVENLDAEGKEKLIEVLLEEESLNTFLISHGFSHPLLEKLYIVKENNISRIE